MTTRKAVLIVSVGRPSVTDGTLDRLLASFQVIDDVQISVLLGYRMDTAPDLQTAQRRVEIHLLQLPADTSLSESRNRLLIHARELGLLDDRTVVNFPDDDSWFMENTQALSAAIQIIEEGHDAVIGRYAPAPDDIDTSRFPAQSRPLTPTFAARCANSVSMVWPAGILMDLGPFDEQLGAGTKAGSSEDLDLLLRALRAGKRIRYEPRVLVGHGYHATPDDRYYLGNIACLRKNARDTRVLGLLCKRLAGGALRVTKRRLPPHTYFAAWRIILTGGS